MKKYVVAASSAKSLTQGNYISKLAKATESIKSDTDKFENVSYDVASKLGDIIDMLERLDTEYSFDKYGVDNPEEFGWFDGVPDSDVNSYYDAYDKFCKAADVYDALTSDIESLKDRVSEIARLLN